MTIGERIAYFREAKGYTRVSVAKRLGMNETTFYLYETNKRTPSEKVRHELCEAYNINREWLDTGVGEMEEDTPESITQMLKKEYKASDDECRMVKMFLELTPIERKFITDFIKKLGED